MKKKAEMRMSVFFFDRRQKNPKEYHDHFLYTSNNSKSHSKSPIYIPDFSFNKVTSTIWVKCIIKVN